MSTSSINQKRYCKTLKKKALNESRQPKVIDGRTVINRFNRNRLERFVGTFQPNRPSGLKPTGLIENYTVLSFYYKWPSQVNFYPWSGKCIFLVETLNGRDYANTTLDILGTIFPFKKIRSATVNIQPHRLGLAE